MRRNTLMMIAVNNNWLTTESLVNNRIIINTSSMGLFVIDNDCHWWRVDNVFCQQWQSTMIANVINILSSLITAVDNDCQHNWGRLPSTMIQWLTVMMSIIINGNCHQWQSLLASNWLINDVLTMIPLTISVYNGCQRRQCRLLSTYLT